MENIEKVLAFNIRKIRKSKKWTQETLADNASLSIFAIQAAESERSWPLIDTITKIADALGVPTTVLFQANEDRQLTNEEILNGLARNLGYEIKKKN